MQDVFRILPAILDESDQPDEVREAVVFAAWRKAAGASLAGHTSPVRLTDKCLTVAVRDRIWKRHLETLSGQMIFKLNSALRTAAVTFIDFEIDPEAVSASNAHLVEKTDAEFISAAEAEKNAELLRAAEEIKDLALRDLFLKAASNSLARKKLNRSKRA